MFTLKIPRSIFCKSKVCKNSSLLSAVTCNIKNKRKKSGSNCSEIEVKLKSKSVYQHPPSGTLCANLRGMLRRESSPPWGWSLTNYNLIPQSARFHFHAVLIQIIPRIALIGSLLPPWNFANQASPVFVSLNLVIYQSPIEHPTKLWAWLFHPNGLNASTLSPKNVVRFMIVTTHSTFYCSFLFLQLC